VTGAIAWFTRNSVAANLMLFSIVAWGLYTLTQLPLEVFPSFDRDAVTIRVAFRGASPAEIEEGVTIKIEEAIQDVEGIKQLSSVASEGLGTVTASMKRGTDAQRMLDDIKQQLDQLNDLPDEADPPRAYIPKRNREVISVLVAGNRPESELRSVASRIRDGIENLPDILPMLFLNRRLILLVVRYAQRVARFCCVLVVRLIPRNNMPILSSWRIRMVHV